MKIKTDPTIQSMSGRFPGSRLVMINPKGKRITNARAHVIPDNIAQQEAFAAKVAAIVAIWTSSPHSTPLYQYLFSLLEDWVWCKTPSCVPIIAWAPNCTIPAKESSNPYIGPGLGNPVTYFTPDSIMCGITH